MADELKKLGLGIMSDKKIHTALPVDDSTLLAQLSVLPDLRKIFWDTFGNFGSTTFFRHLFLSSLALCLCLAAVFGVLTRRADFTSSAVVAAMDTDIPLADANTTTALMPPPSPSVLAPLTPIQFTGQRFSINWRGGMPVLFAHLDMHNTGGRAIKDMQVAIDLYDSRGQLLRRVPTAYPISFAPYGQLSLTVPIVGVPLAVSSIRAVVLAN